MKKISFYLIALAALVLTSSCNKDDGDDALVPVVETQLGGVDITSSKTLNATKTYQLDGTCTVKSGGVLTLPAGTTIIAEGNSSSSIIVEQGGRIIANGTAANPVVMTSTVKFAGSWGGLVICGYAPCNKMGSSEVGNKPYGGNISDDNSGVLKYVRIEYSGYNYTDEKQFNGISLFGVGSGTQISYVSSYKGMDDGLEFFGGTVHADHVVSIDSEDDGIDFADGWQGTGSYWYSYNSTKSGIEGSNNGADGAILPMTTANLSHLTIYVMGEKPWFLKEGAGIQTIDDVIIGGLAANKDQAYFYASSDDTDAAARVAAGDITITNAKFVNMGEGNTKKAVDGLTVNENDAATGAGAFTDATTMQPTWADGWATPDE